MFDSQKLQVNNKSDFQDPNFKFKSIFTGIKQKGFGCATETSSRNRKAIRAAAIKIERNADELGCW